jgi:D-alanyl-lipoteichoic acid acyltransferase DltB (MBOAT superfamily)
MKVFTLFGMNIPFRSFDIVLPVGISFYTFQTMSYSIDIYKKKLNPVQDLISYAAFVSFFPQLVAGPIERAVDLLPQFLQERKFTYKEAIQGCKQILWGLFKKIAIADIAASYVNQIFNNFRIYNSSALTLGAIFFALQIYCDFSGYSDIAIGVSKLFGIKLSKNFSFPYFSRNVAEFWRRWHITLTSWFRDYVYIPLGGSKYNTCKSIRNIFIVFILSGLWHGANWTFITWGVMNAIYFIPSFCMKKNRKYLTIIAESSKLPTASEFLNMVITFVLNTISWIVFRSKDLSEALSYIRNIFKISILNFPNVTGGGDKINRLHNFNFFVYDFRMERTKTQLCY